MKKNKLIKKWIFLGSFSILILNLYACELINRSTTTSNPLTEVPAGFATVGSFQQTNLAAQSAPFWLHYLLPPVLAASPVIQDSSGRSIIINQAWVAFSQVELKESQFIDGTEGSAADIVYPGPYYVNLLASSPAIIDTQIVRQLSYRRLLVSLYKEDTVPTGVPIEMIGHSLFLEGTIDGIPIIFKSAEANGLQLSGANSIYPSEQGMLLLEFHIGRIIKKINLSSITVATEISNSNKFNASNPCPAIEPGASDIYTCFKEGLQTESNLGVDEDGDFYLDDSEQSLR